MSIEWVKDPVGVGWAFSPPGLGASAAAALTAAAARGGADGADASAITPADRLTTSNTAPSALDRHLPTVMRRMRPHQLRASRAMPMTPGRGADQRPCLCRHLEGAAGTGTGDGVRPGRVWRPNAAGRPCGGVLVGREDRDQIAVDENAIGQDLPDTRVVRHVVHGGRLRRRCIEEATSGNGAPRYRACRH
jgi:hypothetical protein